MYLNAYCLAIALAYTGGIACRIHAQQPTDQIHRCQATWAEFGLGGSNSAFLADDPRLGQWRDRIVVVGDPVVKWNDSTTSPDAILVGGIAWARGGVPFAIPPFASRLVMSPRVATTSDGLLHVVYGTRTDTSRRTLGSTPDTLWHTSFDGRAWAPPQPLPSSASGPYWWEDLTPSDLIATGRSLHIAVPVKSDDSITVAILQRDSSGHWSARQLATGGALMLYARLVSMGNTFALTWAAPLLDSIHLEDHGSVFAMRSVDGGNRWSRPQRIHFAGVGNTESHVLVARPNGTLYGRRFIPTQRTSVGGRPRPSTSLAHVDLRCTP